MTTVGTLRGGTNVPDQNNQLGVSKPYVSWNNTNTATTEEDSGYNSLAPPSPCCWEPQIDQPDADDPKPGTCSRGCGLGEKDFHRSASRTDHVQHQGTALSGVMHQAEHKGAALGDVKKMVPPLIIPLPIIENNTKSTEPGYISPFEGDTEPGAFSGTFTHECGGELRKPGSEVYLIIPKGAVPRGCTYIITGHVYTKLDDFRELVPPGYIVGPIPEYRVEGGGRFDEPVLIVIPHCMPHVDDNTPLKVHYGDKGNLKAITDDEDGISYRVTKNQILIWTRHFTRFICSAETDESVEITDALLTVAAVQKDLPTKSVIHLRIMVHSRCSEQTDFTAERGQFYDPGMEELVRLKVNLPERGVLPYPTITISLTPEDGPWKNRMMNGVPAQELIQQKDGEDILCPRRADTIHRSEQLADFTLERPADVAYIDRDMRPLSCHLEVKFWYTAQIQRRHAISLDYPLHNFGSTSTSNPASRKNSQLDPLKEVFKTIAKDIGDDYWQLAIHLGIEESDRTELHRKHCRIFDRNYEMLSCWRKMATNANADILDDLVAALRLCNRNDLAGRALATALYSNNPNSGMMNWDGSPGVGGVQCVKGRRNAIVTAPLNVVYAAEGSAIAIGGFHDSTEE